MALLQSATRVYGTANIDSKLIVGNITPNTSVSNITGSLVVTGGVGVSGNIYSGGIYITGSGNGITFVDGTVQTTAAGGGSTIDQVARNLANTAANTANSALPNTGTIITVNSTSQLVVANTSASTSNTTGALVIQGGVGVQGNVYSSNVYVLNDVIAGLQDGNALGGATNPIIASIANTNNYSQTYIINYSNTTQSSSDFVAYPNNGTDSAGWIDMGITSNAFTQAAYSVTGRNEGYLFMSAPVGSGTSGNLVISTDSSGLYNSIEFYAGGFTTLKGNAGVIITTQNTSVSNTTGALIVNGGFGVRGNVYTGNHVITGSGNGITFPDGTRMTTAATGGGGGSTNSFSNIVVTGQPTLYANSSTAPLTIVAGNNITLTTNSTSNSITFSTNGNRIFGTKPSSPTPGDLWLDATSGRIYTYADSTLAGVTGSGWFSIN